MKCKVVPAVVDKDSGNGGGEGRQPLGTVYTAK